MAAGVYAANVTGLFAISALYVTRLKSVNSGQSVASTAVHHASNSRRRSAARGEVGHRAYSSASGAKGRRVELSLGSPVA
jgi:hypothetical protein